ncbi:MAG: hypothetical protein AAF585_23725, partial [Verrucomicrobiota bacterium]
MPRNTDSHAHLSIRGKQASECTTHSQFEHIAGAVVAANQSVARVVLAPQLPDVDPNTATWRGLPIVRGASHHAPQRSGYP